jgi:hypothetical protein
MTYEHKENSALDKRLDAVGWGLFLILVGGLWLMPEGWVPEGAWLVGAGVIILGLNAVRYFYNLKVSGFWNFMGALALISGITTFLGVDLPVFPILLVLFGIGIIINLLVDR